MADVREPRELTVARAALARASKAHDDDHPDVRAARSAYALEVARSRLADIADRAGDLSRLDAQTLARELRGVAKEIRPRR